MDEETKLQIEDARAAIQALDHQQQEIYKNIKGLVNPDIEDYLWDYCFNCEIGDRSEFITRTKEIIYGD
jgi:hypothetical protein